MSLHPSNADEAASTSLVATVSELLPNRLVRVVLADGNTVLAGPSEAVQRLGIPFKQGQRVLVQRAQLDPGRGIVTGLADSVSPPKASP